MGTRRICFLIGLLGTLGAIPVVRAASGQQLRVQVVDQRGIPVREAVVELQVTGGGADPIRFPWRMAMAQRNQTFLPGTLIVAKGSTVAFPNLDTVRHSIYSFSKAARFSIDLYGRDQTRQQSFPVAGSVALGCNIHDQMRGYIRVVETPYAAKTDSNGYVTLSGMPSGSAKVTVWHPQLRAPKSELVKAVRLGSGHDTIKLPVTLR